MPGRRGSGPTAHAPVPGTSQTCIARASRRRAGAARWYHVPAQLDSTARLSSPARALTSMARSRSTSGAADHQAEHAAQVDVEKDLDRGGQPRGVPHQRLVPALLLVPGGLLGPGEQVRRHQQVQAVVDRPTLQVGHRRDQRGQPPLVPEPARRLRADERQARTAARCSTAATHRRPPTLACRSPLQCPARGGSAGKNGHSAGKNGQPTG